MIAFRDGSVNPGSLCLMPRPTVAATPFPDLSTAARCELAHLHCGDFACVTEREDYVTCRAHAELVAHRLARVTRGSGEDRLTLTPRGREVFEAISARDSGLRLLAGESLAEQIAALESEVPHAA
jgi:hypothetical protein